MEYEKLRKFGYTIRHKEGYLPVPPSDNLHKIRADASLILQKLGIEVEAFHPGSLVGKSVDCVHPTTKTFPLASVEIEWATS